MLSQKEQEVLVSKKELKEIAAKAFEANLDSLLEEHMGEWVAYHGNSQIALENDGEAIYECIDQKNIPLDEVLIYRITPAIREPIVPF